MISSSISQSKNILFIILFLICNVSQAQHNNADFNSLNIETGLSHNSVLSVAQDKKGYLWFASMDGLNRFDSYNIKIYNHIPGDSSSLSGNELNTLFVDDKGRLWIGTVNGGLSLYDDVHDNFINFLHNDSIPSSISSNAVWSVARDSSGNLWIGTENGLNRISKHELSAKNISSIDCKFTSFRSNPGDSNSLSNSLVWSVLFDKSNNGWVGTDRGLNRFSARQVNSDTIQFEHFFNNEKDPRSIAINNVWQLYMDRSDNLWVCSYNGMLDMIYANSLNGTPEISHFLPQIQSVTGIKKVGILNILQDNEFNYWTGTNSFGLINFSLVPADSGQYNIHLISHYVNNLSDNKSLSNNTIYQVFQDTSHVFWIATADGISIYHPEKQKFNYTSLLPDFSVIDGKPVSAIYSDKNKNIVVGTLSEGLYALPLTVKLKSSDSAPHFLKDKAIQTFTIDSENNFWMGTEQGIFFLTKDEYDKFVSNSLLDPPVFKSFNKKNTPELFTDVILSLNADHLGNIWIGTGGGINVWNYKKKILERIFNKPNPAQVSGASIIRCLYTLKSGIVLAGTDKGIFQFDPSVYPFTEKKDNNQYPEPLKELRISSLFENENKILWIGTNGRGLCRYNNLDQSVKFYTTINGLPNNVINSIVDDLKGNLWLSTNNGLSKFNVTDETFSNYNENDGLKSNSFNIGASCKSIDGEIFFGSNKGLNSFYPDRITKNTFIPPIVITDFKIFDKSIFNSGFEKIKNALLNDNFVELHFNQNFFSFEFAALNYINSAKNQYKYKLDGVDPSWINAGNRRYVSYTNIDPGTYTFHVTGSNNDGVWNEKGITIKVMIIPPYYKTWWFRTIIAFLIASLIFFVTQMRVHAIRETKEREVIEHASKMKQQFLANMSHEIRTPMNAIVGMTRLLIGKDPRPDQKNYLTAIEQSSDNLLVIINDILDFSKIEAGKLELEFMPFSISVLMQGVYTTMQFKALEKGLQLSYKIEESVPEAVLGDCVRLNEVLLNLVGNAIKFTPQGNVKISCRNLGNYSDANGVPSGNRMNIEFTVTDTGIGIPDDRLDYIFESFSQASSDTTRKFGGTGLGLTISKHLVELHGGKISLSSIPGNGTVFTFIIPFEISDKSLTEKEYSSDKKTPLPSLSMLDVLLVEDNAFNRTVAIDTLESFIPGISIQAAVNGKQAVEKVNQNNYDLILMDIQMPEMDGYEATQIIRSQSIPPKNKIIIIAMTAGALRFEIQKCFDSGMNDYITKPFDPHVLIEKITRFFPEAKKS